MDARPDAQAHCGGIVGAQWVQIAATGAVVGVNPVWLLRADPLERELILDVMQEAVRISDRKDRQLANMIIEELAKALDRGSK